MPGNAGTAPHSDSGLHYRYFGDQNNFGFSTFNSITQDASRVGEIRSLRTQMRIVQFALKLFF